MRPKATTAERVIGRIATAAHGIVTRPELLAAGQSSGQIKQRLATGALMAQHDGVYRVGHRAPSTEARYMAAVMACGEGAVISGLPAAYVHGLIRGPAPAAEVTAPGRRRVKGLQTRQRKLDRRDVTTWRRIPVTTVACTLVDIAAQIDEHELARACHEAGVRYRTTPRQVETVLRRRHTSPGAKKLRRAMRGDTHVSLSALERKFLQRLSEARLPLPDETNKPAGSKRVDCRWRQQRLTVELDSYRYHNSRHAWEQDRRREREAHARGDTIRRYTRDDVYEHPAQMLDELDELLG